MHYQQLKQKHRERRDASAPDLSLRIHRALSWLHRAELTEDDLDARFIFLWIAFNAAYAIDVEEQYRKSERRLFEEFFRKLVSLDRENQLYKLVWDEFPGAIRVLLDNRYVFQPFWDYHNNRLEKEVWEQGFVTAKKRVAQALARQDTSQILSIIFRRIYTLRNQIIHGGATWNSQANRSQLRDCVLLLEKIVPVIIDLMLENDKDEWGKPFYPYIKDE